MPEAPTEEPVVVPAEPQTDPLPERRDAPIREPEPDPFDPPWPDGRPTPQPKAGRRFATDPRPAGPVPT